MTAAIGQDLDLCARTLWAEGIEKYWEIAGKKTAAFMATTCEFASFYLQPAAFTDALYDFGFALGLLHQFVDDVDDLVEQDSKLDDSNIAHFLVSESEVKDRSDRLWFQLRTIYRKRLVDVQTKLMATKLSQPLQDTIMSIVDHVYGRHSSLNEVYNPD